MNKIERLKYIRSFFSINASEPRPVREDRACLQCKNWRAEMRQFMADDYSPPTTDIIHQDEQVESIRAAASMTKNEWLDFCSQHPKMAKNLEPYRASRGRRKLGNLEAFYAR